MSTCACAAEINALYREANRNVNTAAVSDFSMVAE